MPGAPSCQLASSLWADISGDSARPGVESAIARKTPAATDETKPEVLTTLRPNDSLALYMPPGGSLMRIATRFVLAAIIALGMASAANAKTVMKQCGEQWQAAKANGTTNGQTWPQFLKQCRAQLGASTGGDSCSAAGRLRSPGCSRSSTQPRNFDRQSKTAARCNGRVTLRTDGRAIRPRVRRKREMVGGGGGRRAGDETSSPRAGPRARARSPQTGSLFPWQQPAATAPAPAPATYGSAPPATAAGASASAQQAQYRCPGATLVWVNEKSHIYHFPGTHDYGNTKRGAYMCEADAQAAGNRAAKNEHHP